MPIKGYGVWVAYPISYQAERDVDDNKSPHIHLYYSNDPDRTGSRFTAAINVKSVSRESRLVYWGIQNFEHPVTDYLETLEDGFHALPSSEKHGLDYIRGNLFDASSGMLVEHDLPGDNNDILDYVTPTLDRAISEGAKVLLFGQQFQDQTGIHDIHMNQGNEGRFARDNGIYQDGGILFRFPDGRFTAIFIAFAIQKTHTDDETGQPTTDIDFAHFLPQKPLIDEPIVVGPGKGTKPNDALVIIKAALVNPLGPDDVAQGTPETVRLYNKSGVEVDLNKWGIVNGHGDKQQLDGTLRPFEEKGFVVPDCPLSNRGGTITLLDGLGLKVDGVTYTAKQAKREGRFLIFHS